MEEKVRLLLDSAQSALNAVPVLLQNGLNKDATNRIYKAMLYGAQALLCSCGIEGEKPSAIESDLDDLFAKTGKMDRAFLRLLINARKFWEFVDRGPMRSGIRPLFDLTLDDGRKFVEEMKRLIPE
jgi:uncharacterized protein (UPF0332 family)